MWHDLLCALRGIEGDIFKRQLVTEEAQEPTFYVNMPSSFMNPAEHALLEELMAGLVQSFVKVNEYCSNVKPEDRSAGLYEKAYKNELKQICFEYKRHIFDIEYELFNPMDSDAYKSFDDGSVALEGTVRKGGDGLSIYRLQNRLQTFATLFQVLCADYVQLLCEFKGAKDTISLINKLHALNTEYALRKSVLSSYFERLHKSVCVLFVKHLTLFTVKSGLSGNSGWTAKYWDPSGEFKTVLDLIVNDDCELVLLDRKTAKSVVFINRAAELVNIDSDCDAVLSFLNLCIEGQINEGVSELSVYICKELVSSLIRDHYLLDYLSNIRNFMLMQNGQFYQLFLGDLLSKKLLLNPETFDLNSVSKCFHKCNDYNLINYFKLEKEYDGLFSLKCSFPENHASLAPWILNESEELKLREIFLLLLRINLEIHSMTAQKYKNNAKRFQHLAFLKGLLSYYQDDLITEFMNDLENKLNDSSQPSSLFFNAQHAIVPLLKHAVDNIYVNSFLNISAFKENLETILKSFSSGSDTDRSISLLIKCLVALDSSQDLINSKFINKLLLKIDYNGHYFALGLK
ncbi:hypothetical protein MP638_000147 [Amoeboaphelidium occidentale]|nr:hypothetical protein MP638_000147 [Amoeboaphelidium occidentale]